MEKTTDQLVRIAAAGGGMRIDSNSKTTDQLVRIAAAASVKAANILIINAESKTTDQLVRIAAAGRGCVSFDFTA
ncbi:hypothetical protein [Endozoicomonas ascidiicola]|uniref:hypothetical protein n=1 Tax=Endozoicomonas ascidiicola TaxID=1698521 RepID=UPI00082C5C11|nr:hypothetical protein [Endozoicomonas ascidiicola]